MAAQFMCFLLFILIVSTSSAWCPSETDASDGSDEVSLLAMSAKLASSTKRASNYPPLASLTAALQSLGTSSAEVPIAPLPTSQLLGPSASGSQPELAMDTAIPLDDQLEDEALAIDAAFAQSELLIESAWKGVRRAPLIPGPFTGLGRHIEQDQRSVLKRVQDLADSVPVVQWYFFAVAIVLIVAMDLVILQHVPEIERTHVGLLAFWVIVAAAFCAEVWVRQGQKAGISWASGYLLELTFSFENVFVFNVIFHALETPRRLMRKALLVTVIGSMFLRFAFIIGLADAIYKLAYLPYILGAWLIYTGSQQVTTGGRCEEEDVTQNKVVRGLRWCLGARLGEFYDEEGEALFLPSGKKGAWQMTLLGAAVACLLASDLFFGPDATLVKMNLIPNLYVNFSSSVLALFTLRALFFVVRDILSHLSLARYCTGIILVFVGAEMMAARFTEISALMSLIVVVNVIMLMAAFSAVRDSACPKRVV